VSRHIANILHKQGIDVRAFDKTLIALKDRGLSHASIATVAAAFDADDHPGGTA
jgi:hypothetical protein